MVFAGFGNGGKINLAFPTGRMKANDYQGYSSLTCWGSDWRSILDFSVGQCYYSCCKLHLGMVSAEWGTRNGLVSKFARPEPYGELMGHIMSLCIC